MNEVLPRWNIIYNGNCRFKIGVYLAYKPPVVKISLFGLSLPPRQGKPRGRYAIRIDFFHNLHQRKSEYSVNFQRY